MEFTFNEGYRRYLDLCPIPCVVGVFQLSKDTRFFQGCAFTFSGHTKHLKILQGVPNIPLNFVVQLGAKLNTNFIFKFNPTHHQLLCLVDIARIHLMAPMYYISLEKLLSSIRVILYSFLQPNEA